jgi:hypothetical protein
MRQTKEVQSVVQPDGSDGKGVPTAKLASYEEIKAAGKPGVFSHPAVPYLVAAILLVVLVGLLRRFIGRKRTADSDAVIP